MRRPVISASPSIKHARLCAMEFSEKFQLISCIYTFKCYKTYTQVALSEGRCAYENKTDEAPPWNGAEESFLHMGKKTQPGLLLKVGASEEHRGFYCSIGERAGTNFPGTSFMGVSHFITSKSPLNSLFFITTIPWDTRRRCQVARFDCEQYLCFSNESIDISYKSIISVNSMGNRD